MVNPFHSPWIATAPPYPTSSHLKRRRDIAFANPQPVSPQVRMCIKAVGVRIKTEDIQL